MPALNISYAAHERYVGRFPDLVQRNLIVERAPSQVERPLALVARPGLKDFVSPGQGPIRGIYQKSGLFSGDAIVVSGEEVYRVAANGNLTTITGAVANRNRVKIDLGRDADGNEIARIATGSALYLLSGTTVTEEDFPDTTHLGCTDILEHRSFWIAAVPDSDRVYYIIPGESTWNLLDFASAEYQPDKIVALDSVGDLILMFGDTTVEAWALTGDANNPIQPAGGIAYDVGCRARDAVVSISGVVFWVDERCNVRMSTGGGSPAVISNSGLTEQIRAEDAEDLRAWAFGLDGHLYYVLHIGSATWVYDASSEVWSRFTSKGLDYWRAQAGVDVAGVVIAADGQQGSSQLWKLDTSLNTDAGDEIDCVLTAFVEVNEGRRPMSNLTLRCALGDVPRTGQGSAPLWGMRFSDDETGAWGPWQWVTLPVTGRHAGEVRWNRLGQVLPPGRIIQLRCTDPITRRVSDVRANVP